MSNFLVMLPVEPGSADARALFDRGRHLAKQLKRQQECSRFGCDQAWVAAFARGKNSGTPVAQHAASGSWILAAGTWFHRDGDASGAEEKLLRRYLETGALALARELEGFFCIAIGDGRSNETWLITDLVGSCHAFMRTLDQATVLSGSSRLLAALAPTPLDPVGCQEFLRTGVIYEDRTLYRDVHKLAPATVYRFARGRLVDQQRYWSIGEIADQPLSAREAPDALWAAITTAAARIGRLYPHPVCDLTGGYDSRALFAALRGADVPLSTTVSGAAHNPDVVVSQGLASLCKVQHLVLNPTQPLTVLDLEDALALTDGEFDVVEYARILQVHRTLQTKFDISLNGSFGEVARGYWWELLYPRTGACEALDAENIARKRYATALNDATIFTSAARLDLVAHFTGMIQRTNDGLAATPNTLQMDHAYLMMRMQRWQGRIASSTDQLWPCLSPFIFRSVLEVMLRTEPKGRDRSLLVREMLARHQPYIARYPLEHGYPALPATWRTWPLFWPVLPYYGGRALKKAVKTLRSASTPPHVASARDGLWKDLTVQQALSSERLGDASLFDAQGLGRFMEQSRTPQFSYDAQWARMLSLGMALRPPS